MKILITILIIAFSVISAQNYFSLLGLDLEIDDYNSFPIEFFIMIKTKTILN